MNGESWIKTVRSLAMPPAFEGNRLESAVGSLVEIFALVEIRNGDSIDLSEFYRQMLSKMISNEVSLVLESDDFK